MKYLQTIQLLNESFVEYINNHNPANSLVMWRDGESPFLLPDSIKREEYWLKTSNADHDFYTEPSINDSCPHPYPMHPMSSWLSQQSMTWLVHEVARLESSLEKNINPDFVTAWLGAIGSDNLSSIEKSRVHLKLNTFDQPSTKYDFYIDRANKSLKRSNGLLILTIINKQ